MSGFEWLYIGGATLIGYIVIILIMVFSAILCTITDRIKMPNWFYMVVKIIFFLLIILFSVIMAYGMGDLVIQNVMN